MQKNKQQQAMSAAAAATYQEAASVASTSNLSIAESPKPMQKLKSSLKHDSAQQTSTPSDQSARSSQTSSTMGTTKVVSVNLAANTNASTQSGKGKKSKRKVAGGAGQKRAMAAAAADQHDISEGITTTQTSSSNASVDMPPQRSRSEAPTGNSIGNVLYEVHKKLMSRGRKLSPTQLLAKQQERQQRAEHLRAKIELSRKEWCKKVSQRQLLARARQQETVERKRLNLQDRLEQAARNKEAELQNVVEKARAENEKAEETKFIIKLTKQNNKLDLNHKLSENEERRKLQLSRDMARIKGQELKREAAAKRREEHQEEIRTKLLTKEHKREQAEQRRKDQQIAEKNKALAEKVKRDLLRARKNIKRTSKISDIMSFVSNRNSLWEFIGMEQDLDSMGLQFNLSDLEAINVLDEEGGQDRVRNLNENELLKTIQQDQFELEKLMLKKDHEILSQCILEEADGTIRITKNPLTLLHRGGPKSSSSGNSIDSSEEKKDGGKPWGSTHLVPSQNRRTSDSSKNATVPVQAATPIPTPPQVEESKYFSPVKQSSAQSAAVQTQSETASNIGRGVGDLKRLQFAEKQHSQSFASNVSSNKEASAASEGQTFKDEIMTQDDGEEEERKAPSHYVSEFSKSAATKDDEKFEQKLVQQRVRVAMRRNILKRNLSEDLVWAAELQSNPNFDMVRFVGQDMHQQMNPQQLETRSQASSLERNSFDDLQDEMIGASLRENPNNETPPKGGGVKIVKTSVAHLKQRKAKQKHQKSNSSLHSSGPINAQALGSGSHRELNPMMKSQHSKRNSFQELQQTFQTKQKPTLSKQGSCSSLSSLIKTKQRQEDNEEFSDMKGGQTAGTLNQAQLESLGPVVKMTINGFPFTQNIPPYLVPSSPNQQTLSGAPMSSAAAAASAEQFDDCKSQSFLSSSTATGQSFLMNSLIVSQRPVPSKTNLSSMHHMTSNLSRSANQYLFPIREQKIILMYKERGPELNVVQAKINIKVEEVKLETVSHLALATHNQQTDNQPTIIQHQQSSAQSKRTLTNLDQATESSAFTTSPFTPQKTSNPKFTQNEETKRTPTKNNQYDSSTPNSAKKGGERNSTHKTSAGDLSEPTIQLDEVLDDSIDSISHQSDRMVNQIVKKLLIDQMQHIRIDDSQKSIIFDKDKDSQAVLKYLEVNELKFKYCRLCEVAIYSEYSASSDAEEAKSSSAITEHFLSKTHLRKRDGILIKESEDLAYSLLVFISFPGDIEVELRKENEKALKRKVKRLKQMMSTLAVSHENASTYPGKELKSQNKNRLQIRCIELQKSVFPDIKFDTVEAILNDVLKVLEKRGAGDLHLLRKLKFVPNMVDMICKRITTCPRAKLSSLAIVISLVIKILNKFCSLRENRNYMIQTNRLMPLIELLSWCLNRQTELFFGIEFMPGLFQTITTHLKHRVPYECQLLKEHMVDLLICSQIPAKLKNKLAIVKSIQSNENEDSLGQVPFFLLKSVAFLEALTAIISIDSRTRPIYEKSIKIGEHVFFVLQSTELLGITQMITTLLLTCNETFKASAPQSSQQQLVLPQTILSLTIFSIKCLNNMMRMDVGVVQHMMLKLNEQLYHLLNFILSYTETNIDQSDDVKELLHETLIFIGYLCLLNEGNQQTLHRGENSILQKLCNLPFTYFMDKRLKEILFPTLVTVSYLNNRSVAIMDQEMNINETLVKYIEQNIAEELPKIVEQEQEYFSDHTKSMSSFGRTRSPSQHSTGSNSNQSVQMDFLSGNNPYIPLVMRFPKNLWKDAAQYYKSKAD